MAKLMFIGTHASDDPTKAALTLVAANGASEAGHEPVVALVGEGVYLMKDEVAASTAGVGWGPVKEQMATTITNGVPIYI